MGSYAGAGERFVLEPGNHVQMRVEHVLSADFSTVPSYIVAIGFEFGIHIVLHLVQQLEGRMDLFGRQIKDRLPMCHRYDDAGVLQRALILLTMGEQNEVVLEDDRVVGAVVYISE